MTNKLSFLAIYLCGGFAVIFCMICSSCNTSKHLRYFQDLPDSTKIYLPPVEKEDRIVETGDNLTITINAEEKEAVDFFNPQKAVASTAEAAQGAGYLVNLEGVIEFPIIGKVTAVGLTAKQLKESLTRLISKHVKDPLVEVRFNTFRVTVIGEVRSPGLHTLPLQRTTIFEVLASAGDLSQNAKRYDIFLYRDYKGERTITKIDLRKKEILYRQDLFQMRHNDVLYIQPMRSNVLREDVTFYTSFLSILIGVISIGFTIFNN